MEKNKQNPLTRHQQSLPLSHTLTHSFSSPLCASQKIAIDKIRTKTSGEKKAIVEFMLSDRRTDEA